MDLGTRLLDFLYFAGVQASGANKNSLYLSVHLYFDSLEVDTEFPFCDIIRVAHL